MSDSLNTHLVIDVQDVSYTYPGKAIGSSPVHAVDAVSMQVQEGTRLGILGPNGGGKSTLIKLILGLLEPQQGSIRVLGKTPKQARREGLVGYLPQRIDAQLDWPLSVEQVVMMGRVSKLSPWKRASRNDRDMVAQSLEYVGMNEYARRPIAALSGGQLQRVMIARAIANHPKLLVLDEPTVGVDVIGQQRFAELIEHLRQELRLSIVVVSHDMRAVAAVADRIACLSQTLHFHDSPEGLTPAVLAQVFAHNVEGIWGDLHINAHRAEDCDDDCEDHQKGDTGCCDHDSKENVGESP